MGEVLLFIASSMDGYIARDDDSLDWLTAVKGEGDNGFQDMYDAIETIVMGRKTYDIICNLVDKYPHDDRITYVFSDQDKEDSQHIKYVSGDVRQQMTRIFEQHPGDVWLVGGGELVTQFLHADLIDRIVLTIAPIHLGSGVPLIYPFFAEREWDLQKVSQLQQFAQLTYRRRRKT